MTVSLFLLALMASTCVVQKVQTHALVLDAIMDKVGDMKAAVTGNESGGEEEKKDDKYEGGIIEKMAHRVVDGAVDRIAHEAKDQYGNALTKPMISMAAEQVKDRLHDTVSDLGGEPEGDHEPKEGEGIVGKLIEKVTRRKRSIGLEDGMLKITLGLPGKIFTGQSGQKSTQHSDIPNMPKMMRRLDENESDGNRKARSSSQSKSRVDKDDKSVKQIATAIQDEIEANEETSKIIGASREEYMRDQMWLMLK